MFAHAYNIRIDISVGKPVHGIQVVYGFNDTKKWLLSMLMTTVQLPGTVDYDSQMEMHTSTAKTDISLES